VFAAIGFIVQIAGEPLAIGVFDWIRLLLTGREPIEFAPMVASWLATWIVVALTIGWFLQSIVVIATAKHENTHPSA
jgi:hypothetical protein